MKKTPVSLTPVHTREWWFSREPFLDENAANTLGKPTAITRGMFHGYSLPINGGEEALQFRVRAPFRWDGITNPWFVAITSILAAEDVGDKYKFQLQWASKDIGYVIPDAADETLTAEVTVVDGTAYYAEIVAFEMDATKIISGENIQGVLQRITSGEPAVTAEVGVWHWDMRWKANKVGKTSPMGYNNA